MANSVLNWVWDHSRSRHSARLVLLSLADSTGKPGGWTWPSVPELMCRTGLGERAVQTATTDLARMGEIEVEYNAGPKGCNRYRVLMTPAESAPPPQSLRGARNAGGHRKAGKTSAQAKASTPAESAPPAKSAPPQNPASDPANFAPGTLREPIPSPTETARTDTAQALVAEWLDHCRKRPPDRVIGQVSRELRALLDEGQDAGDVRRGLAQWHRAARHPSTLPSFVNEVMNGAPSGNGRARERETTGIRKMRQASEAADDLQAMVDQGRVTL